MLCFSIARKTVEKSLDTPVRPVCLAALLFSDAKEEANPMDSQKSGKPRARARVDGWRKTIDRLRREYAADRRRLGTLKRNTDLASAEYRRLKTLYEKDDVGTRSGVEQAVQALNAAADAADRLARAVDAIDNANARRGAMTIAERLKHEGKTEIIQKQISKRFGAMSPFLESHLQNSEADLLDRFGESMFDFNSLKDAENWWKTRGKAGNA